jgi:hypothetical protein
MGPVVSDQINSDWACLQANHMSRSFKTDSFKGVGRQVGSFDV